MNVLCLGGPLDGDTKEIDIHSGDSFSFPIRAKVHDRDDIRMFGREYGIVFDFTAIYHLRQIEGRFVLQFSEDRRDVIDALMSRRERR